MRIERMVEGNTAAVVAAVLVAVEECLWTVEELAGTTMMVGVPLKSPSKEVKSLVMYGLP